jgi:hypothetical protein
MLTSYVVAYVLCTTSACQLIMPDSSTRWANAVECEANGAGLPASYGRDGALATRTCVAVPGEAPGAATRKPPLQRTEPTETTPPDTATEALNSRQLDLLRTRDGQ